MLYAELIITAFFLSQAPAWAKDVFTWEKCVELAAKNNGEIRAAEAFLRAKEEAIGSARSGFLPNVRANVGATEEKVEPATTSSTSYSAGVSANQNLFHGLLDLGKVKEAGANLESAKQDLVLVKARISFELKTVAEDLAYAKAYVKFTEDLMKRREHNAKLVDLKFQSGRENKGSMLLSKAYFQEAKLNDLQARHDLEVSSSALARILGFSGDPEIDIEGEVPIFNPSEEAVNFERLALGTPKVKQAIAREDAADANVRIARSSFFPSLDATGNIGRTGPSFFPQRDSWSVGIGLTFSLFNGLSDYHGTRGAIELREARSSEFLNTTRDTLKRLKEAHHAYVEAVMKLRVDEEFRDAANIRAEIARSKYNNGILSFEDWDVIESDSINRRKVALQSKRDRVSAEAKWEQIQGKGVIP